MRTAMKYVYVNRHNIAQNKAHPEEPLRPPFSVKTRGRLTEYGHTVYFHGAASLVYMPNRPAKNGATVWIETRRPVTIDDTVIE